MLNSAAGRLATCANGSRSYPIGFFRYLSKTNAVTPNAPSRIFVTLMRICHKTGRPGMSLLANNAYTMYAPEKKNPPEMDAFPHMIDEL